MDTRGKIISFGQALEYARQGSVQWVTGYFDPLLAEHARRLGQLARPDQTTIAVIRNPPEPLLPQRARAELVAALSSVDYVVMRSEDSVSEDADEARITREFLEQVVRKSRAI